MIVGHFNIHFWLSWLFAVAFAGALSSYYELQTVLISTLVISSLNFIALRLSWKNRENIERLKSLSDNTAVAGMLVFVVMLFASNMITALIWLIAFIQLALNLTFKEDRHFHFGLLVTFVLLSAGAAESKTGIYLFYIIAYCVLASISLGYYFMDRRLQQNQGTHQHMRWPLGHRIKVISILILLSFVIYLIIPRFEAANFGGKYGAAEQYYSDKDWEKQAESSEDLESPTERKNNTQENKQNSESLNNKSSNSPSGESRSRNDDGLKNGQDDRYEYRGFSDSFDIRGEQQQGGIPPNVIVAYMKAEHGAYLKVETFDMFDGISWHKSLETDIKKRLERGEITLQSNLTGNYNQSISIKEKLGTYIPAASIPVQLAFPSTVISVDAYEMLKIPSGLAPGTHYSVDSSLQFIRGRVFSGDHYQPRLQDLKLPDDFDPRIQTLSEKITQGAKTELDKAQLLEAHLRENYAYSYDSIFTSQNKTPVAKFLFDDKKGHCEYFASSLAVMLRSLGIHSRLVTGFSASVENPLSGYYEIRVLDGHAWVEAWVDGVGWAVFEPTPFYILPTPNDETTSFEKIQEYVEQLERMQEESGINNELSLENVLITLWQNVELLFVIVFGTIKLFVLKTWKLLILLVVTAGIVFILWKKWQPAILKRLSYFKVKSYKPKKHEETICFYMEHIQILMRINGIHRYAGTTIEQYVRGLQYGIEGDDAEIITSLMNQSYYNTDSVKGLDPLLLKAVFMKLYRNA